jgi:cytochrome c5
MKQACALAFAVAAATVAAEEAVRERLADGQRVYEAVCAECHRSGTLGAPVVGDQSLWKPRSDLWEAVLFEHAERGWLAMPSRGGDQRLSDYEVEAAAEYMLSETFPELPGD